MRGFGRLVPPRPPMPWTVAVGLRCMVKAPVAVGVLLSFDCYLRIGELMALVREDIAFGNDRGFGVNHAEMDRVHIHLQELGT